MTPMPRRYSDDQIFQSLSEAVGGFGEDADWVAQTIGIFPVPDVTYVPELFESLGRLASTVPWVAEALGGTDQLETLRGVLGRIRKAQQLDPGRFPGLKDKQLASWASGSFALAGTLHGHCRPGRIRTSGVEALRAVLWVCRWRWAATPIASSGAIDGPADETSVPLSGAIEALAAAIRVATGDRPQRGLPGELLLDIGEAAGLAELIAAAEPIKRSPVEWLANAWTHFDRELRGVPRPIRVAKPTGLPGPGLGPGHPRPPLPPLPRPPRHLSFDEDVEIERVQGKIRTGYSPSPLSMPPPLPGELPGEVQSLVHVAQLPSVPRNEDAKALVRYQVQQAVRGTNYFLLTNHPDVLPHHAYAAVVRRIIERLAGREEDPGVRFGLAALLVQAITGRTARTLTALDVVEDATCPHDPDRIEFLRAEGAFRLSVFWQVRREGGDAPSFFRPDEQQQAHLEPVGSVFLLPVAPMFRLALRGAEAELRDLAGTRVEEIEGWIREAARAVGEDLGVTFTPGQLRASVATHLFDLCRDSALTQIICADTLGSSDAPLSYYAPRAKHVATTYWTLLASLAGDQSPMDLLGDGDARIGAPLLASLDSVRAMARAPSSPLRHGVGRLAEEGRARDVHLAMVNQLATMLMVLGTHRPTEALFELTLGEIWTDGKRGAALFRDKVHDAAHDPRLVVLPPTLVGQVQSYLEHLHGMAEACPALAPRVEKILRGQAPLLFGWTDDDSAAPLSLADWRRGLPACWQVLPLNWGRHWLRTRGIEEGMRPELVSMQLGHLDAAGYPFSGASPTNPQDFIDEASPGLERLARLQGWQVVKGLKASKAAPKELHGPLMNWDAITKAHEASARALGKQWRDAMRFKLRTYREQAEKTVLSHPELVSAGIIDRYESATPVLEPHGLSRQDFERIRDELSQAADGDMALSIAISREICRVARRVNKRSGQPGNDPAPLVMLRRPHDNAFLPGMMGAVRQVAALRDHLVAWPKENKPGDWRDFPLACARTVLAMALFGFCDDPKKIRGAMERRRLLQRPVALTDAILVPYGDQPHEVLGLRDIAATAMARLAWKYPKQEFPGWEEINERIADMLPGWAIGGRGVADGALGLVGRLCQTVAISNRLELSPATRLALGGPGGCTNAHIDEQIALIDGDPAGTVQRHWETGAAESPGGPDGSLGTTGKGNSRTQYNALCRVLLQSGKETSLPLTGVVIPASAAAAEASRPKIVAEISAMLAEGAPERRLQPITRLLAGWTLDMLMNGTAGKKDPAYSTVHTYLTRIGGKLVEIFGQSSMGDINDAELEDAYVAVIEAGRKRSVDGRKGDSAAKTAAAILGLHAFAIAAHDFPEVDLAPVHFYLRSGGGQPADARLVLPKEREGILAEISRRANSGGSGGSAARGQSRLLRQANAVLPLMAFGGARRGEALGIQFRDLSVGDGLAFVRIRANASRRLKTRNARRSVGLSAELQGGLLDWADADRSRIAAYRSETAYVFSPLDDARSAEGRAGIAEACLQACRDITGRRYSRLHAFRHLVAMERTTPAFLSKADAEALADRLQLAPLASLRGETVLPRDLQAQILALGHGNFDTTLAWYHHMPWLLRSSADARVAARYLSQNLMSTLLGVTPHALEWARKNSKRNTNASAWLDVQWPPRIPPKPPATPTHREEVRASTPRAWTARELGDLLGSVSRTGSLQGALQVLGAAAEDEPSIRRVILPLERRLGRRILEEHGMPAIEGHPSRCVRTIGAALALEHWWEWYDRDHEGRRHVLATLAEAMAEHLVPADKEAIRLPAEDADQLESMLKAVGLAQAPLLRSPRPDGTVLVRVVRPEGVGAGGNEQGSPGATRYLGMVIKRALIVIRVVAKGP